MKRLGYPRWHHSKSNRSFPERYWEGVLNRAGIQHQDEFQVLNPDGHYYSLDFKIDVNGNLIALEIDGEQHKDRVEHDKKRDSFISSIGYIVYRVPWNYVNNDSGK